jgi:tRNA(Ile2) C34 agmatinyltransferase TiaS
MSVTTEAVKMYAWSVLAMTVKRTPAQHALIGRAPLCRKCYRKMSSQANLFGGQDYLCERCGGRWTQDRGQWVWSQPEVQR